MKLLKIAEKSKVWFSVVLILAVVSIGSIAIRGLNFGIDFVGGTIITIDLGQKFETADAKKITDQFDKDATITYSGDNQESIIISTKKDLSAAERQEAFDAFKDKYVLEDKALVSVDTVSATVGSEMTRNAILAVVVAIVLMLIYISFRFEIYFGLSSVFGLMFDILVVIGCYALFQIQVNTPFIAAILTILGYGINDTIVTFDRIRENLENTSNENLDYIVDLSVTQTIKRSIYTSLTTLLAILGLYIFGVSEIRDFALPIIIGIITSTYASLCVASPFWLFLKEKFPNLGGKNKKKTGNTRKNKQPVI